MDIIQNLQDLISSVPADSIPGLIVIALTAIGLLTIKIINKNQAKRKDD